MAAVTAEYYFRFRMCWCHCLQKVKVYQQTKFRRDISIGGWIFSPYDVTHHPDPQKDSPSVETPCFIWAIQRNDQCDGLTWGQDREKNSITKKVTKVIFPLFGGESPRWADSTLKLHGGWCRRRNHVCQVSNWNLHGLWFYRGVEFLIFPLILAWGLQQCSANALPVIIIIIDSI